MSIPKENEVNHIEITPPPSDPLNFPLRTKQTAQILGIPKSRLTTWEKNGVIDPLPRAVPENTALQEERQIGHVEFTKILLAMSTMQNKDNSLAYPWLEGFDPTTPGIYTSSSGYELQFGSDQDF